MQTKPILRIVMKETLNNGKGQLDLIALSDGVYFLKFKLIDRIKLEKIVISK